MEPSRTLVHVRPRGRRNAPPPAAASGFRVLDDRPLRAGELALGRYRLLERLGAGGFGVVWRAHDEQLDREVALKRIPLPSEQDRERAMREALASARLAHPAIVALYEACADGEASYLISELVEGHTLAQLIAQDELGDEQILEIGAALAGALEHAHARGVVHRDVKPQNVIVVSEPRERGGVAKLTDFGGAQLIGEDALTRTGDVLGTLAYMAPEQSEGREIGAATDVYSLALVLYEAFSGVNPLRGPTPAATVRRIGRPIESLARRRRDLGRPLTRAIDAALQADPRRRGTLADLRRELEEELDVGMRDPRTHGPPLRDGDPRTHRPPLPDGDSRTHGPPLRDGDPRTHGLPLREGDTRTHGPLLRASDPPQREGAPASQPHPGRLRALGAARLWLVAVAGVAIWQAAAGRPGASLLVLAAGAPLTVLLPRIGPAWIGAALAPALGMIGLAGAYPALAGQGARWRARAALAALGFWWLALAEPLVARRLWAGPPAGMPARAAWESSIGAAATHVLAPAVTAQLLVGMAVWALAASVLPWIVRGRSAALDVAAAVAWTVALLAAAPLVGRALTLHMAQASPRGALMGAAVGCVLAVCARALRGPV